MKKFQKQLWKNGEKKFQKILRKNCKLKKFRKKSVKNLRKKMKKKLCKNFKKIWKIFFRKICEKIVKKMQKNWFFLENYRVDYIFSIDTAFKNTNEWWCFLFRVIKGYKTFNKLRVCILTWVLSCKGMFVNKTNLCSVVAMVINVRGHTGLDVQKMSTTIFKHWNMLEIF